MVQVTNREYSEQTWQMARKMAGIDPTRVGAPTPPTPTTLRDELRIIVERLYTVRANLARAHRGLFGHVPEPAADKTQEPNCVRDDLDLMRTTLTDIEQYAKEIEERIG